MVLIWGGGFVGVGTVAAYLSSRFRLPILGGSVVFALVLGFTGISDNHGIRLTDKKAATAELPPLPVAQAFSSWFAARLPAIEAASKEHPYPVVIVASAGGGIRAGYWTSYALARLQDDVPQIRDHMLGLSGVSGGSLGIAAFTAVLAQGQSPTENYTDRIQNYYQAEFLSPLLIG